MIHRIRGRRKQFRGHGANEFYGTSKDCRTGLTLDAMVIHSRRWANSNYLQTRICHNYARYGSGWAIE